MSSTRASVQDTTAPDRPSGSLSAFLWDGSADVYDKILIHPFLDGLADGTLPSQTFHHYLVQDGLYLSEYARALRMLVAKAPEPAVAAMFSQHAEGALTAETALHEDLLVGLGVEGPDQPQDEQASPSNCAYTSFLLATAGTGVFADGLAAVLPCYWIYWRVGVRLAASSPDPVYARWIETYGGAGFGDVTEAVLAVVDSLGDVVGRQERTRMREHYRTGARYEWMFWEAAYRRERWPV